MHMQNRNDTRAGEMKIAKFYEFQRKDEMNYEDEKLPSAQRLMEQAGDTASSWMYKAVREIDELFGKGYAKSHPELIAGFMRAAGADEIAMHLRGLVKSHQRIEESLEVLIDRVDRWANE